MINTNRLFKSILIGVLCLTAGCTISTGSSSGQSEHELVTKLKQLVVRNSVNKKITTGTNYEDVIDLFGRDCDQKTFDKDEKLFYCDFSEEGVKDSTKTNDVGLVFTKNKSDEFELTFMAYRGVDLPDVRSLPTKINRNNYVSYLQSKATYPNLEIGTDLFVDMSSYVTLDSTIDGDTSRFKVFGTYKISDEESVQKENVEITRFLGVDTPETHHPDFGIQPWGEAGKQFTSDKEEGAINIVLELDQLEIRETYGRLLAYIWLDGIMVNLELLEMGIANPRYNRYNAYYDELIACYFDRDEWQKVINIKDPNWNYESPNYTNNTCLSFQCSFDANYRYNFTYGF